MANLKKSPDFVKKFDVEHIMINNYVIEGRCYSNNNELSTTDAEIIQSADVFINQVIEKDRGFLNNDMVNNIASNIVS
jgi:hypothetical protein